MTRTIKLYIFVIFIIIALFCSGSEARERQYFTYGKLLNKASGKIIVKEKNRKTDQEEKITYYIESPLNKESQKVFNEAQEGQLVDIDYVKKNDKRIITDLYLFS